MAAPHVAGAWATLKQVLPNATVADILSRLQNTGVPVTDRRNSLVTPRIQLDEAVANVTGASLSPPTNDDFVNIINAPVGYAGYFVTRHATNQNGLNLSALNAGCGGGSADKDVWFRYQSPTAGTVVFSAEGSSFDTLLAVWTNVPAAPNLVGCHDNLWEQGKQSRLTVTTTANTTYYIQVGGRNNVGGRLHFSTYIPSNNDAIANAKLVPDIQYVDALDTTSMTHVGNDPIPNTCGYPLALPTPWYTVWYRYVPAQDERVVFNTAGSSFNTLLTLWKGQPGNLTEVACNDDVAYEIGTTDVNRMVSAFITTLNQGETYYLMAGGKSAFFTNIPNGELKVDVEQVYLSPTLTTPIQIAPAANAVIGNLSPTLTWNAVSGASAYDLQIDTIGQPATTLIRVNGTQYQLPSLQANSYYWRVRAVNGSPTSSWSTVRKFTYSVTSNSAGDAPPRNLFTTSTPTLTWSSVSWATKYEVVIAQNNQFRNPVYTYINVEGLELQTDMLIPGTYYWRVRPLHDDGSPGTWNSGDTFVIATG